MSEIIDLNQTTIMNNDLVFHDESVATEVSTDIVPEAMGKGYELTIQDVDGASEDSFRL